MLRAATAVPPPTLCTANGHTLRRERDVQESRRERLVQKGCQDSLVARRRRLDRDDREFRVLSMAPKQPGRHNTRRADDLVAAVGNALGPNDRASGGYNRTSIALRR